MITLIGSAHVFDISQRIEREIRDRDPPIVAVELDRNRYAALKSGERKGDIPLTYRLLQRVQERIAHKFGVDVGEEMLTAVDTAEQINSRVAFIDLPAQQVLNKLMSEMSLKEKLSMFLGGIVGLFTSKERVEKEMDKYYSNKTEYSETIEDKVPTIAKILIEDRNKFMAKNLRELEDKFDSVLAVVGDAHVPGMMKELEGRELQVLRLKEIQQEESKSTEKGSGEKDRDIENNTEVSFSYNYNME